MRWWHPRSTHGGSGSEDLSAYHEEVGNPQGDGASRLCAWVRIPEDSNSAIRLIETPSFGGPSKAPGKTALWNRYRADGFRDMPVLDGPSYVVTRRKLVRPAKLW